MNETCFACNGRATSVEHVPPLCLFPERKDSIDGRDHRRNLITVPACPDHNMAKSLDDQYLFWVLSINVAANSVGQQQALTKLARSHHRRPTLGDTILEPATEVVVLDSRTGAEHEAAEAALDESRFDRVLGLIARGLYWHHFRDSWLEQVRVHADFIGDLGGSSAEATLARLKLFEGASAHFAEQRRYGDNPDVFWYQVSERQARCRCVMRLAFYGGCTATAFFTPAG